MALAAIEFSRPIGLAALALPVVLWWLARHAARPAREATGTLELWRTVGPGEPDAAVARERRTPAWLAFALAALACAALALGGPRFAAAREPATWRVLVDRSPSMYLPLEPGSARTRLDTALERALALLAKESEPGDVIEWADGRARANGEFPREWREPPWPPRAEPAWPSEDRLATLWITDRAPEHAPERAGIAASGGAAMPGVVAARGRDAIDWDGEGLGERADALPPARISIDVPGELATTLRPLVAAWAATRDVVEVERSARDVELALAYLGDGAVREVEVARDGWSARARASALPPSEDTNARSWLTFRGTQGDETLVRASVGRVELAIASLTEIRGDPAAFAVSWADLLDSTLAPQREVIALSERADAGAALSSPPTPPPRPSRDIGPWIEAALATCAALLGLAALAKR